MSPTFFVSRQALAAGVLIRFVSNQALAAGVLADLVDRTSRGCLVLLCEPRFRQVYSPGYWVGNAYRGCTRGLTDFQPSQVMVAAAWIWVVYKVRLEFKLTALIRGLTRSGKPSARTS